WPSQPFGPCSPPACLPPVALPRRPPRASPFPYTTLFRSGSEAATDFFMELQRGYFTGATNPFKAETVIARAVEAGLEESAAREAHAGTTHDDAVEAEVREAVSMGARGVPFFLFNDKYTAPGALPTDAFRQALRQIAEEARASRVTVLGGGESCAADGTCD